MRGFYRVVEADGTVTFFARRYIIAIKISEDSSLATLYCEGIDAPYPITDKKQIQDLMVFIGSSMKGAHRVRAPVQDQAAVQAD